MNRRSFRIAMTGILLSVLVAIAAADDIRDEAVRKDQKQIEGTWRVMLLEVDGNKSRGEDAQRLTVVNGPDGSWSLRSDGKEIMKGTSTPDPTRKVRTIDFTPTEGDQKGLVYPGIYEISEKTRMLCFAPPGKERPTKFESAPGTQHILVKFERVQSH